MQNLLNIILVQSDIIWLDIHANLERYQHQLQSVTSPVDLIVFPEMFLTGFITETATVPIEDQEVVAEWMLKTANRFNCITTGSHPFFDKGKFYNRFLIVYPDGKVEYYNKRHLFTMGGEKKNYEPGTERIVFKLDGWRIMPMICYDLRFPVWSRNNLNYDLLVYSANWPKARNQVWETLLEARAIENQCYVAGVNRTGIDGAGIGYIGRSRVVSPMGEVMATLDDTEGILSLSLDKVELDRFRKDFPLLDDTDEFEIKIP